MVIRAFITHKEAELFADCQDRFGVNPDTKSIAVSDGMGSTWQQKIWAQLLVDSYTDSQDWSPSAESIQPLCFSWKAKVLDYIQNLKDTNAPINILYRNERNLVAGRSAGATFAGIRFNGTKWKGTVLGDSCLIEWNGNNATFYTSQEVEAFDSYPDYFDSDPTKEGKGTPKLIEGALEGVTFLLLVSDPFSEFLLEHSKQSDIAKYIQQLLSLASHDDFEALVCEWRKEGMHNDDTTIVIVENDNSEDFSITHADNIVEMIERERLSQDYANHTIENAPTLQDNPFQEEIEVVEKFVVVQNNENAFITDFLTEYQRCIQKRFPKHMGKLKFKWTQKAAEEALNLLFERYSVNKK